MSSITINPRERIAIIGSGGKTTLMCNLARSCPGRVIMTTTTHLAAPHVKTSDLNCHATKVASDISSIDGVNSDIIPSDISAYVRQEDPCYPGSFAPFINLDTLVRRWQQGETCLLTARLNPSQPRLTSLTPAEVDAISTWPDLDRLIVEADGSKRLPIKAHKAGEPVLFSLCTLGIAVIGLGALHRQVTEGEVHRAPLLRQLLGCSAEHRLTPQDIARTAHAYLSLLNTPHRALVLSQAEHGSDGELEAVLQSLRAMLAHYYPDCELAVQKRGELL